MSTSLVRLIEEIAANAWPPEITQHLGGWRIRYSGGNSRRVNSVWPNQRPAGDSLETALSNVEDFYQHWGAIPRYQICPAVLPEDLPNILKSRGYLPYAHTAVKTASTQTVLANTNLPGCEFASSSVLTDTWFQTYVTASGYSQATLPIRRGILTRIGPPANFIVLSKDGTPCAVGLGVLERGWLGVFCVVTTPDQRRKGFAHDVMNLLASWGDSQGAENVYLQVMEENRPALRLYQRMGFEHLYQYSYYQPHQLDKPEIFSGGQEMRKLVEIARFVDDIEQTAAFYEILLGKAPAARSGGMAIFMLGETKLFLHQTYQPGEDELPPEDHLAFEVDDLDQTCIQLTASGLKIEIQPKEYYWGRSAYLRDPAGQVIELIETNST